jgi:hypothetical protein
MVTPPALWLGHVLATSPDIGGSKSIKNLVEKVVKMRGVISNPGTSMYVYPLQ